MTDSKAEAIVNNIIAIMEAEGFKITDDIRSKCFDIAKGKVNANYFINKILKNYKPKQ